MPDPGEVSPDAGVEHGAPELDPTTRRDWRALLLEHWRLVIAGVTLALGVALVILGWYGAAYTNIITEQIPYLISGGLLGLGLIIFAGVLAASAAQKRDTDELRRDLARAVRALASASADIGGDARPGDRPSSNGHRVFTLPGGRSFHEAGCPIIEGKPDVAERPQAEAVGSGFAACKLCAGE